LINAQWEDFMSRVGDLGNMVAMVDQSGSMIWEGGNPYYAAFGMGIAIATKSALGKRVMTFSDEPCWVSLEGCETFCQYVQKLQTYDHLAGGGTNFFKALSLVLDACIAGGLSDEVVSGMTLAIFSDMQIDETTNTVYDESSSPYGWGTGDIVIDSKLKLEAFSNKMASMQERIALMYKAAGYRSVPHMLFWNLRSTNGFPSLSTANNTSMFSGFSPVLLNSFCEKGVDALDGLTPWIGLLGMVNNPRFDILGNKLMETV
jgi:hypothetical protein